MRPGFPVAGTLSASATRQFTTIDHMAVSVLWLALFAQWMTIVPIILPDQVAGIMGTDGADKAGVAGSITSAGAIAALLVAPIAGALSDRRRAARGRRRPFLLSGIVVSSGALVPLAMFGPSSSLLLYALAIVNLQFWWNWAAGPYAGLIPDTVPAEAQSQASGWLNVMSILGTIIGNVLLWALYRPARVLPLIIAFILLNVVSLSLTLRCVREPPGRGAAAFELRAFARSFFLDPRANANLYWVLVTRLLANMGIWSVFTFLLFYLESVVGLERGAAVNLLPLLLLAGTLAAIPASILGVRFAARHGIVRVVCLASWIMAAAVLCFALIAVNPNLPVVAALTVIFGAANGAYGAVDWALALKVLPAGQDAGKDMGIWHISMVLPQILGPALMGWLITAVEHAASAQLAYAIAFLVAATWFTLAAVLVLRVQFVAPASELQARGA